MWIRARYVQKSWEVFCTWFWVDGGWCWCWFIDKTTLHHPTKPKNFYQLVLYISFSNMCCLCYICPEFEFKRIYFLEVEPEAEANSDKLKQELHMKFILNSDCVINFTPLAWMMRGEEPKKVYIPSCSVVSCRIVSLTRFSFRFNGFNG